MKLEEIAKIMMEEHHEEGRLFNEARIRNWKHYRAIHSGDAPIDEEDPIIKEMRNCELRMAQEFAAYYAIKDILEKYESGWAPDDEEE